MLKWLLYYCFYLSIAKSFVYSDHFFGGTMSWQVIEPNRIEIKLQQKYSWFNNLASCQRISGLTGTLALLNGTNFISTNISIQGQCTNYDFYLQFLTLKNIKSLIYPLNTTILLAFQNALWKNIIQNSNTCSLVTFINLTRRDDNKQINSSPITSMPAIITLPIGTRQIIRIPMIDIDRDIAECRWAINNSTYYYTPKMDECGGICQNLPNAQLITSSNLDNNCTLIVNISTVGYYAIAIQIEDFMPSAPYYPLSSIPLQFVIRGINDSCYSPTIIGQIDNGVTIIVSPNTAFSTSIIAKTGCNQTKIIKFSADMSPLGVISTSSITRHDSMTYSMVFTWTPTVNQIGTTQLYCTIAIDDDNRQSIQYCLNFVITEKTGE